MMIVAWVCLTPIGIFTARNMRGVLNNPVGLWFKIHVLLQIAVAAITVAAIFVLAGQTEHSFDESK